MFIFYKSKYNVRSCESIFGTLCYWKGTPFMLFFIFGFC
jgi:hypothetical protein